MTKAKNSVSRWCNSYSDYCLKGTELRPVHTNPFSNENGAVSLRIRLSSTLQRRQRSPKTEPFENVLQSGAIWKRCFRKRCFLVWTVKTMLSENGDVIKTTRPWVSKMADRRYHVASISRQFRGPIYWNAHASSSFDHVHWGYNSFFKQIRGCNVDGRKR